MKKNHFAYKAIMAMEQRYRATFINSLGGFKSVCLIGTQNKEEQTNLAIFSSIVHIGANPPLIGIVVRPDVSERHTLENILDTKYYTINHIHSKIVEQAHHTSARYPRNTSEFDASGLTTEYKEAFFAPFVQESNLQLGIEFKEKIDFTINGTIFIIGEIKHIFLPSNCLQDDGFVDLALLDTITCSGLDSYHTTNKITRLPYAKPTI
jgi:flavin reductase (DIM6/NTAB) family NADH-FMN oxidoreductase RutF